MALVRINSCCYQRNIKSSSYRRTDSTRENVSRCTLTHSVTTLVLSPSHYKPVSVLALLGIIGMTPFSTALLKCLWQYALHAFNVIQGSQSKAAYLQLPDCAPNFTKLHISCCTLLAWFKKNTHTLTLMLSRSSAAPSVWRHRQWKGQTGHCPSWLLTVILRHARNLFKMKSLWPATRSQTAGKQKWKTTNWRQWCLLRNIPQKLYVSWKKSFSAA